MLDLNFYKETNPDLARMSEDDLVNHWINFGKYEGRFPNLPTFEEAWKLEKLPSSFDYKKYLFLNPDLPFDSDLPSRIHFFTKGRFEHREFEIKKIKLNKYLLDIIKKLDQDLSFVDGDQLDIENFFATEPKIDYEKLEQFDTYKNVEVSIIKFSIKFLGKVPAPSFLIEVQSLIDFWNSKGLNQKHHIINAIIRISLLDCHRAQTSTNLNKIKTFQPMGTKNIFNFDVVVQKFDLEKFHFVKENKFLEDLNNKIHQSLNQLHLYFRKKRPKFSLICSLYDGDSFITTFLENITNLREFYKGELIIIDADSPGNEFNVIKKYIKKYPNIKYIRFDERISIYKAWNEAIKVSEGELITNVNLDDLRLRNYLKQHLKVFKRNCDIDVVYGDFYYVLKPNFPIWLTKKIGIKSNLPLVTSRNLLQINSPHCAPMWRKSLHFELGYFDEKFMAAGDWEFWLRCVQANKKFGKLKHTSTIYYLNPNGLSTSENSKDAIEQIPIRERYLDLLLNEEKKLSKLV